MAGAEWIWLERWHGRSPAGKDAKVDPPGKKAEARRLTRVLRLRYYPVRIVDGRVYVNDIPLKDDYVASEYRSHDDWGPQVIPEGYYFVMGDHRNNSSHSRHWDFVPKRYIIGKVQIRWWPIPTARVF